MSKGFSIGILVGVVYFFMLAIAIRMVNVATSGRKVEETETGPTRPGVEPAPE